MENHKFVQCSYLSFRHFTAAQSCLSPDVANDDLQQKLHVFFVFSECLVIFLYQCHTPFCCVINSLHGAETTFRSSIAFLFLPHRRICGQKFSWQMKEVEQVHGVAGVQVIQCAWMERVWWNFWAFVWSVGFCSAATMSLFVAGKKRSSNKANPTSSCDRYQRWDESFLLVANEIAAWMLE